MAIRWKKAKGRRVAPERARAVGNRRRFDALPSPRGISRVFIILLFYVATVALLFFGNPPLDIRPGEVAHKHYISRVRFTCEDQELTEKLREAKRQEQPNVYVSDRGIVTAMSDAVTAELKGGLLAGTGADGKSSKRTALLAEIKKMGAKQAADAVRAIFVDARRRGVIDDLKRTTETKLNNRVIVVLDKPEGVERQVRVDETISLQNGLKEFLKEEIGLHFSKLPEEARTEILSILLRNFKFTTLKLDAGETAKAREEAAKTVPPQMRTIEKGAVLLAQGATTTPYDAYLLEQERAEYARSEPAVRRIEKLVGSILLVLIAFVILGVYIYRFEGSLVRSNNRLFMLATLCFATLFIAKLFVFKAWPLFLVPVPLVGIIVALAYGQQFALMLTFAVAAFIAVVAGHSFDFFIIFMAGGAASVLATRNVRNRTRLIHVGILAGVVLCAATWTVGLLGGQRITRLFWESLMFRDGLLALGNGVLVGLAVTSLLPLIEKAFGIMTDISLLEWCDQNQPLLRRLVLEAPGTYHHSLVVGNLAEAAAEAIGANALLARAGAYFHDIGKLNKPEYFVENVGNDHSRHDHLSPTMSTLIITAHTKDGAELADHYDLPGPIRDMILQHHGTTLVEFFYEKAKRMAADNGGPAADEDFFRYRGPLPRSKEAGIVLLADSVESASRTLSEPTPAHVRQLVREVSAKKLMDSQFVESGLTLTDIRQVEDVLIRGLTAIFHSRIRYR
ncbi:MAG: HDIG domain-containing protein [Planctomycetes bacterium]|nr:HDIG domain-containing protein [Planctomycetota bacterium]